MKYNGLNIKRILDAKGMKARDLAKMLGKSEQTVPYWIKAESITTNTLIQLAEALDVPITEFFDDVKPVGNPEELQSDKELLLKIWKNSELLIDLHKSRSKV